MLSCFHQTSTSSIGSIGSMGSMGSMGSIGSIGSMGPIGSMGSIEASVVLCKRFVCLSFFYTKLYMVSPRLKAGNF